MMNVDIDVNLIDLNRLNEVDPDQIPAVLAQLAAASQQLAARLLAAAGNSVNSTKNTAGDRLLTAKEAAQRCGVSVFWLYEQAREGHLPFVVRLPSAAKPKDPSKRKDPPVRFSEAGLEKWIRSRSGR